MQAQPLRDLHVRGPNSCLKTKIEKPCFRHSGTQQRRTLRRCVATYNFAAYLSGP